MNEEIKQALNQFSIEDGLPIKKIYEKNFVWQIGDKYILKLVNSVKHAANIHEAPFDAERLTKIIRLNNLLHQENAPVASYYTTVTNELYATVGNRYYTLADKLPGKNPEPDDACDTQKRTHSLGKNLAILHLALKKLEGKVQVYSMDTMGELHGWILKEIRDKKIAVRQEVIDYCIAFGDLYHRLPRQIIHRDPHGGNILYEGDDVTGFIDFDITQVNIRIFDMCYAFAPNKYSYEKWLVQRQYFFSGYHKVSPISDDEMVGYAYMSVLLELLCVAFWSTLGREDKLCETLKGVHWLYSVRNEIELNENDLIKPI